jgi:hypothetical protein
MKKNTTIIIIVIAIIVIAVAVALLQRRQKTELEPASPGIAPTAPAPALPEDSTQAINEELQVLDVGDIEQDFQGIDADLDTLAPSK